MSKRWPVVPFASLYAEPSRNGISIPKSDRGVGILLVNMKEVFANGRLTPDGATERVPVPPEQTDKWLLQDGDLLFGRRSLVLEGAGKCVLVVGGTEPATFESSIIRVRLNAAMVDPRFVHYFFNSSPGRQVMGTIVEQVAVAGIRSSDLANLPVPLPPLPEQRRIAGVLVALDELIETNQRITSSAEALGSALVSKLAAEGFDMVDGAEFSGWSLTSLGDIAVTVESGGRPKGGVAGIASGVPSIGAESVKGLARFDFSKTKFVPRSFVDTMKRGRLESRDVLVYKDGGKPGEFRPNVAMFGDGFPFNEMTINEHVYRVRVAPPLSNAYLYFWLSSRRIMDEMAMLGTGAAIPGLNSTAFKSLPVAIPPASVRDRLFPTLDALVGEALGAASEARDLSRARDELLPLLLSGRVSVREVAA